ncbi:Ubiquitin carboxyl-terminal hydrolase family protein [Cryptosporidium felis]|nr:Ubiquitin carboxyl-terminal hydrolase family protein [Cryptosporidium felis]
MDRIENIYGDLGGGYCGGALRESLTAITLGSTSFSSMSSSDFNSISTRSLDSVVDSGNKSDLGEREIDIPKFLQFQSSKNSENDSVGSAASFQLPSLMPRSSSFSPPIDLSEDGKFLDLLQEKKEEVGKGKFESSIGDCRNGTIQDQLLDFLVIQGVVLKYWDELISTHSGELLCELLKLEPKMLVEGFFGIYSFSYFIGNLPPICSFLSTLFELSFKEGKMSLIYPELWIFFEFIFAKIMEIFQIHELSQLPLVPVVYWIVDEWNKYEMFLNFEKCSSENKTNTCNSEYIIKNKINRLLFSLHIREELDHLSSVSEYYFKSIIGYNNNDISCGCVLYALRVTELLSNLLFSDEEKIVRVNYKEIVKMLEKLDKISGRIFLEVLETIISHSKSDHYTPHIPTHLFSVFFLLKDSKHSFFRKILREIVNSMHETSLLNIEQKKSSFSQIINLLLHACKDSTQGGIDTSVADLLLAIFDLNIHIYLGIDGSLRTILGIDLIIKDLSRRLEVGKLLESDSRTLSGLYMLQWKLLAARKEYTGNKRKVEFSENLENIENLSGVRERGSSTESLKTRLIRRYLFQDEMERGMRNIRDTCYLNSAMQCLSLSYYFLEWLLERTWTTGKKPKKLTLLLFNALTSIIGSKKHMAYENTVMHEGQGNFLNIVETGFFGEISHHFELGKEHDICELIRYILENIDEDCSPFMLTIENCAKCLFCGTVESFQNQSFSIIDLYINDKTLQVRDQKVVSLDSLIYDYFSSESVPKSFDCRRCKTRTDSKRWISLKNPSRYVVLAIHNYYWSKRSRKALKRGEIRVNFGEIINLESRKYVIYAFVFHHGHSIDSGHYFVIGRKHFYNTVEDKNPTWFKYSDQEVTIIRSMKEIRHHGNPFLIFALLMDN